MSALTVIRVRQVLVMCVAEVRRLKQVEIADSTVITPGEWTATLEELELQYQAFPAGATVVEAVVKIMQMRAVPVN